MVSTLELSTLLGPVLGFVLGVLSLLGVLPYSLCPHPLQKRASASLPVLHDAHARTVVGWLAAAPIRFARSRSI